MKVNFLRRSPLPLPHLTIAQRVIDTMVANALRYETETGESLVGLSIKPEGKGEPDLFVLDTIPPDESAIRLGAYFEQGDDTQGDIFSWWWDNWELFRERQRSAPQGVWDAHWDVPLANLGDWHKHPGTLTEPSYGDAQTAHDDIHDSVSGRPQLVAILATVWDRRLAETPDVSSSKKDQEEKPQPLKIPIDAKTVVRLDGWYMSKHTRRFVPLTLVVADNLPALPILPWHVRDVARARREVAALTADGYTVSVEQHDADGEVPLEICFLLAKRSSQNALIVVTAADFPDTPPTLRTAPMAAIKDIPPNSDLFLGLWKASQPVPNSAYPVWTPQKQIIDFVREAEATH